MAGIISSFHRLETFRICQKDIASVPDIKVAGIRHLVGALHSFAARRSAVKIEITVLILRYQGIIVKEITSSVILIFLIRYLTEIHFFCLF